MIKKLSILIIILSMIELALMGIYSVTANDTITNEIAIEQLNGGDEEYIVMQAHNEYKMRLLGAIIATSFANVTLIGIVVGSSITTSNSHE